LSGGGAYSEGATGAEDQFDMCRTDMFSNGHGDLVLSYGLAVILLGSLRLVSMRLISLEGAFSKRLRTLKLLQEATLTAAVAQCKATVLCKNESVMCCRTQSLKVKGCSVEGAGYVPETLEARRVWADPCNALSMPEEAAVVAIVCDVSVRSHRVEGGSPHCGWAKELSGRYRLCRTARD